MNEDSLLSKILCASSLCSKATLENIERQIIKSKQTLFQWITQHNLIQEELLNSALSEHFRLPRINLSMKDKLTLYKPNILAMIKEQSDNDLIFIISNPGDLKHKEEISFQYNKHVSIAFAPYKELTKIYNQLMRKKINDLIKKSTSNPSAKILTDYILSNAIHDNASDIHIEINEDNALIRHRIDGLLQTIFQLPTDSIHHCISCIKVASHIDIAIKRTPQDGRLSIKTQLGYLQDARVSSYPTLYGEKLVIRLLNSASKIKTLSMLGLSKRNEQIIEKQIQKPQGLILVTGPTGSGKTMTLYAILQQLNVSYRNITTIEDPIEIPLKGVNQSQVNPKIHFTFDNALRALLRQDPDVIMIGEIRDKDTASLAMHAAQTGHLVLATLHTNSAAESITRLINLGVSNLYIKESLSLVIAQRLVRKLCLDCNANKDADCFYCLDGYSGRTGIFDILTIKKEDDMKDIQQTDNGLWQAALIAVKKGITTFSEITRVIPNHD